MANPFFYVFILSIGLGLGIFLDGELSTQENISIKSQLQKVLTEKADLQKTEKTYTEITNQFCQQVKGIK